MRHQVVFLLLLTFGLGQFLTAQVTTGGLEGLVSDEAGEPLPGATVIVLHLPTGSEYGTVTSVDGEYSLGNLRPGGPYEVRFSFVGYGTAIHDNIEIPLGGVQRLDATLSSGQILTGVTIAANRLEAAGTVETIGKTTISNTPSADRSIKDVTRRISFVNGSSVAGNSFRYNNLSIDGASSNDALGFYEAASGAGGAVAAGTPGALSGSQPIGLDAIAELQVALAPYDVRQGNFTGASINAVTRSGSNFSEGSVYGFSRFRQITGRRPAGELDPVPEFTDFQGGARWAGPIRKDKFFLFANLELVRRSQPALAEAGTAGSNFSSELIHAIADTLISRYDYDPGSQAGETVGTQSNKIFLRFDANLGKKHFLTIRDNLVVASQDELERSQAVYNFGNQGFVHRSTTNSLVAELRSIPNGQLSNKLLISLSSTWDERDFEGRVFPHIDISYLNANSIFAGTYREASIYGSTVHTLQIADNVNLTLGNHHFTLGTSNDLIFLQYRFLTAWNGRWEYDSPEDFFADRPDRIRGVYNLSNNDYDFNRANPSADIMVFLLSAYAQDRVRVTENLSATLGLRLDLHTQPDGVPENPQVSSNEAFAGFGNQIGGKLLVNPRFGFEWTPDERLTVRGGSGIYSGRIPFAWYAYAHYISGLTYGNVDIRPEGEVIPIEENLADLADQQPGLTEINLIEDGFQLPRAWRSSLAADVSFCSTWFSVEGNFTEMLSDIWFQSLNRVDSVTSLQGADDRPYYVLSGDSSRHEADFTNVFALGNTNQGWKGHLTLRAGQQIGENLSAQASWTFGRSMDVSNGVRNSPAANWNWNPVVDPRNDELSASNFDLRHRLVVSLDWVKNWGDREQAHQTEFHLLYSAASGSPFTYTYAGDLNRDGSTRNDLVYVPADASEINLVPILGDGGEVLVSAEEQWIQLDEFISSQDVLENNRGAYVGRNEGRTPWNRSADLRVLHHIQIGKGEQTLTLSLDILNLGNLIHPELGKAWFVPNVSNSTFSLIRFTGIEDGEASFQFENPARDPWVLDPFFSRWRGQLGLRYSF